MKMMKSFKKPITRIINEGIRIKNRDVKTLLNLKNEHYGPSVKRTSTRIVHRCVIANVRELRKLK